MSNLKPNVRDVIGGQFPVFINNGTSNFVRFIELYYEWMETNGNPLEFIRYVLEEHDYDTAQDKFKRLIESGVLNNLAVQTDIDKSILVKNIKQFFRSKGSEDSFKFLFNVIYSEEVDLEWGRDLYLKSSDSAYRMDTILVVRQPTVDVTAILEFGSIKDVVINSSDYGFFEPPSINVIRNIDDDINHIIPIVDYDLTGHVIPEDVSEDPVEVKLISGGTGYMDATVVVHGDCVTPAVINATVEDGKVKKLSLVSGGVGYKELPTMTIESLTGSGAEGSLKWTAVLGNFDIIDGKSGWAAPPTITFLGGLGYVYTYDIEGNITSSRQSEPAQVFFNIDENGTVKDAYFTGTEGENYTSKPTIRWNIPINIDAVLTSSISSTKVTNCNVVIGGTNYITPPSIEFSYPIYDYSKLVGGRISTYGGSYATAIVDSVVGTTVNGIEYTILYLQKEGITGTFDKNSVLVADVAGEQLVAVNTPLFSKVDIISGGSGYRKGQIVNFDDEGVGGTVLIDDVSTGAVDEIIIANPGHGYKVGDKITSEDALGSGLVANVNTIDGIGFKGEVIVEIDEVRILDNGYDYAVNDIIYIYGGEKDVSNISDTTKFAKMKILAVGDSDDLRELTIANAGYGYRYSSLAIIETGNPIPLRQIRPDGSNYDENQNQPIASDPQNTLTVTYSPVGEIKQIYCELVEPDLGTKNITVVLNGTGASLTETVTAGEITNVVINTSGVNYVSPVVKVVSPTGSGATFDVEIDGFGSITNVSILHGGSGYAASGLTTLEVVEEYGVGALITPIFRQGGIDSLSFEMEHRGEFNEFNKYGKERQYTILGGSGTGLVLDLYYRPKYINVIDPGKYYSNYTLSVTEGHGSGCVAVAEIRSDVIKTIGMVAVGSGYSSDDVRVVIQSENGTGFIGTPEVVAGEITGITIIDGGYGYSETDQIDIIGENVTPASAEITDIIHGTLRNINLISGGSHYHHECQARVTSIQGVPTQEIVISPIIDNGVVKDFDITNRGEGYYNFADVINANWVDSGHITFGFDVKVNLIVGDRVVVNGCIPSGYNAEYTVLNVMYFDLLDGDLNIIGTGTNILVKQNLNPSAYVSGGKIIKQNIEVEIYYQEEYEDTDASHTFFGVGSYNDNTFIPDGTGTDFSTYSMLRGYCDRTGTTCVVTYTGSDLYADGESVHFVFDDPTFDTNLTQVYVISNLDTITKTFEITTDVSGTDTTWAKIVTLTDVLDDTTIWPTRGSGIINTMFQVVDFIDMWPQTINTPKDARYDLMHSVSGKIKTVDIVNGGYGYFDSSEKVPLTMLVNGNSVGTSASATAVMSGNVVDHIDVTDGGEFYTSVPTVTISGVGTGATASANLTGYIRTISVDDAGSNFYRKPDIIISEPDDIGGIQASAEAVVDFIEPNPLLRYVIRIEVLNGGTGYDEMNPPNVTISGNATAVAVVNNGVVVGINMTDRGNNYTAYPTVTIDPPISGTQATAVAWIPCELKTITVINSGTGYHKETPPVVSTNGGGGTNAVLTPHIDYTVGSVDVINGGSGYTLTPSIVFSDNNKGSGAILLPVLKDGSFIDVEVVDGGGNYTSADITVDGGHIEGTTATFQAFIENGAIKRVGVLNGGTGYYYGTSAIVIGDGNDAKIDIKVDSGINRYDVRVGGTGYIEATTSISIIDHPPDGITGGFGAEIIPVIVDGEIVDVKVIEKGQQYHNPEAIISHGSGSGAVLYVYADRKISDVTIVNRGLNYRVASIKITGDGVGANLKPNITKTSLDSAKVTYKGNRYSKYPVISVKDNSNYGAISSTTVSSGGYGYREFPSLAITTTSGTGAELLSFSKSIGKIKDLRFMDFALGNTNEPIVRFPATIIVSEEADFLPNEYVYVKTDGSIPDNIFDVPHARVRFLDKSKNMLYVDDMSEHYSFATENGNNIIMENYETSSTLIHEMSQQINEGDVFVGYTSQSEGSVLRFNRAYGYGMLEGIGRYDLSLIKSQSKINCPQLRIHDNMRYQEYSYIIKSGLDSSTYRKEIDEMVHPAGYSMYGDIEVVSSVKVGKLTIHTTKKSGEQDLTKQILSVSTDSVTSRTNYNNEFWRLDNDEIRRYTVDNNLGYVDVTVAGFASQYKGMPYTIFEHGRATVPAFIGVLEPLEQSTYTIVSDVITVTSPRHGLLFGARVKFEPETGTALHGDYYVDSIIDGHTFTIVSEIYPENDDTSGTATIYEYKYTDYSTDRIPTWEEDTYYKVNEYVSYFDPVDGIGKIYVATVTEHLSSVTNSPIGVSSVWYEVDGMDELSQTVRNGIFNFEQVDLWENIYFKADDIKYTVTGYNITVNHIDAESVGYSQVGKDALLTYPRHVLENDEYILTGYDITVNHINAESVVYSISGNSIE